VTATLGGQSGEHYLGFKQHRASTKAIKLFMIPHISPTRLAQILREARSWGPESRAGACSFAGHDVEVLAETVRLVTDDDRSVVDPQPIKIRLVIQPETRRLLGCQDVGANLTSRIRVAKNYFCDVSR
jgi:hypothetical protein